MIENDDALKQSCEAMHTLYRILRQLKLEMLPHNPLFYSLMSESPIGVIKDIQREIDEYCGLPIARHKNSRRHKTRAKPRRLAHHKARQLVHK